MSNPTILLIAAIVPLIAGACTATQATAQNKTMITPESRSLLTTLCKSENTATRLQIA